MFISGKPAPTSLLHPTAPAFQSSLTSSTRHPSFKPAHPVDVFVTGGVHGMCFYLH